MMKIPGNSTIIPTNEIGKALDLTHTVTADKNEDAIEIFNRACTRLLNPVEWHELAGVASASFKLISQSAPDLQRPARLNDHIQIDIPGPGSSAGGGFDWVKIETIEKDTDPAADESFGIKLRACANPNKSGEEIAHFFTEDATSTFIISRKEKTVTASYHGRNEKPNSTEVILTDKIRNSIVAVGAMAGFSNLQWQALIHGLLKNETTGAGRQLGSLIREGFLF